MITRVFIAFLVLSLLRTEAPGQCQYPPGFSYTDGSICWGYAQARAFGCNPDDADNVYPDPPKIFTQFFTKHGSGRYLVGDIIVFGKESARIEDLGGTVGHASYVAEIREINTRPDGELLRSTSRGRYKVRDDDPVVDNTQIIMHEVSGAGGTHNEQTLAQVIATRANVNEVIKGVYRLKENYMGHQVTFRNSFEGGRIGVGVFDNGIGEHVGRGSPFTRWYRHHDTVSVRAYTPQKDVLGNWFTFANAWIKESNQTNAGTALTADIIVYSNDIFTARFNQSTPSNSVFFDLRSDGQPIGGILKVNGETHTAPTPPFAPGVVCSLHQYLYRNRVTYQFQSWNDSSTSLSRQFPSPGSYISNYSFVEVLPPADIYPLNNPVGEPIKITWTAHPSPFVTQYEVWRKVKDVQGPTLLDTLPNTTTMYEDGDYALTSAYSHNLIEYDIRARYVTPSRDVTSNQAWFSVFGMGAQYIPEARRDDEEFGADNSTDAACSFAAHPNPFNPATKITATLPLVAHVEITVYDMAGRLVARLADRILEAGTHGFDWSAHGNGTSTLVSGVYIARIIARPLDGSPAGQQSLKLILTK